MARSFPGGTVRPARLLSGWPGVSRWSGPSFSRVRPAPAPEGEAWFHSSSCTPQAKSLRVVSVSKWSSRGTFNRGTSNFCSNRTHRLGRFPGSVMGQGLVVHADSREGWSDATAALAGSRRPRETGASALAAGSRPQVRPAPADLAARPRPGGRRTFHRQAPGPGGSSPGLPASGPTSFLPSAGRRSGKSKPRVDPS